MSSHIYEGQFNESNESTSPVPTGVDVIGSYSQVDYGAMSGDSLEKLREQWADELRQVDEEIQTLRQVLNSKFRRQQYLKRQLGITAISELREEVKQGLDTLRTSDAFVRTSTAVKNVTNKTSAAIQEKWSLFKHSNTFKSLEGKVGSAYSSVRLLPSLSPFALTGSTNEEHKLTRSATIGEADQAKSLQETNPMNWSNNQSNAAPANSIPHSNPKASTLPRAQSNGENVLSSVNEPIGDEESELLDEL